MRIKTAFKRQPSNTSIKKNLYKTKIGFIFILLGSYFVFSDTLGFSAFIDDSYFDDTLPVSGGLNFSFFNKNTKITSSIFFYLIAIFFIGWELFDQKIKIK